MFANKVLLRNFNLDLKLLGGLLESSKKMISQMTKYKQGICPKLVMDGGVLVLMAQETS